MGPVQASNIFFTPWRFQTWSLQGPARYPSQFQSWLGRSKDWVVFFFFFLSLFLVWNIFIFFEKLLGFLYLQFKNVRWSGSAVKNMTPLKSNFNSRYFWYDGNHHTIGFFNVKCCTIITKKDFISDWRSLN